MASDDSPRLCDFSEVNLLNLPVHRYRKTQTRLGVRRRFDDLVQYEGQFRVLRAGSQPNVIATRRTVVYSLR